VSGYISIKDDYKEAIDCVKRTLSKDGYLKAGHEKQFKLARTIMKNLYNVQPDPVGKPDLTQKNYRDEDGHVKIHPRNF